MKISIIGAGFSGLTLAYFLNKKGFEIEILEATSRAGGLIYTHHTDDGMVETAATSLLLTPKIEELLKDISLMPLLANKESAKRFILKKRIPRRLPLSFTGIISLIKGLFRLLLNKEKWRPQGSESLSIWGDRVFSPEVKKYLISPAMQGIYADSAENLSASLVLKKIFTNVPRIKSKGAINFSNGMGELIQKLVSYLESNNVEIKYDLKINKENFPKNPTVLATSMKQANLLLDSIPLIPFKNMTTVTLFFSDAPSIKGFGILFPKEEGINANGVLLNNCMFEKRSRSKHSETWIMSDVHKLSDKEILNRLSTDRKKVFKRDDSPIHYHITSWADAFPIYGQELEEFLSKKISLPKNVFLTGNYLGNLGLSGIVEQNSKLAETLGTQRQ